MVSHVPPGLRAVRHLACSKVLSFDIPEARAEDFPVVIDWKPSGKGAGAGRSFRLSDDGLLTHMVVNRSSRVLRLSEDHPAAPLIHAAIEEIVSIRTRKGPEFVLPGRSEIDSGNWAVIDGAMPERADRTDLFRWERAMSDLAASYSWIEGHPWRPCGEPVVCVFRNAYGWHTGLTHSNGAGGDITTFRYPVDRWEEAEEACRRMAADDGRDFSPAGFFHDPSYRPEAETDLLDIGMVVAHVADNISRLVGSRTTRADKWSKKLKRVELNELPVAVFEAYAVLRRACEDATRSPDGAVEALEAMIDIAADPALSWLLPQADSVAAHVEKWHARPVRLSVSHAPERAF